MIKSRNNSDPIRRILVEKILRKKRNNIFFIISTIATTIATIILVWSNIQTKKIIKIQQDSLEIQQKEFERIDTTLELMKNQINIQHESNVLQREFNYLMQAKTKTELEKFIEEKKPIIKLNKLDCTIEDKKIVLYYNFKNIGKSIASNVKIEIECVDSSNSEILKPKFIRFDKINKNESKIYPIETYVGNFSIYYLFLKVNIKWNWYSFNKEDSSISYKIVNLNIHENLCNSKTLSNNQADNIFKQGKLK